MEEEEERQMVDLEAHVAPETPPPPPPIFTNKANHTCPVVLKFEEVDYKATIRKGGAFWKKKKPGDHRHILKGISGIVLPGEMLAMLGPSGSGKTTLITALGGRLGGHLAGAITYNGKPFSNQMKRCTGFVTQDDALYPHLTVTETLVFTALLRLPNTITTKEKAMHAEAVITELGLSKCKDSIIGGPFLRGVSGGERKRVSIGQEMLINPSLLFLDEPTSGLDSTTAQRIVSTLWELANGGRTVVMTIHQPSSRLFYMFHKVLLLSEGNPLYFGKGEMAMEYFSSIGFTPSVAMNPADFLLDLANGIHLISLDEYSGVTKQGSSSSSSSSTHCDDHIAGVSSDDIYEDPITIKQTLVLSYRRKIDEGLRAEIGEIGNHLEDGSEGKQQLHRWATTWCQQCSVLFRRGVKERRHESFSGLKIGQVLVVSFLSGLLWWQSDTSHLQDQIGLLFFTAGFWGFFPLFQAIFTFPQERMMLEKERSSGMYRLSSYFMSRTIGDLPMELVLPTIFVVITYWMAGLKANAITFLHYLFALLFSVLVSQGLGLALGAAVMDQKSATILGSVIMLSFLLAGGYYVQNVPHFIAWIKYVSISHYTYKLLLGSLYNPEDTYPCSADTTCSIRDFPSIELVGLGGQTVAAVALAVMLIGYRLVAYMALMRIGVPAGKK